MSKAIEWVKKSVGFCAEGEYASEAEKKVFFQELENEYINMDDNEKIMVRNILSSSFDAEDLVYVLSYFVKYMNIKVFREQVLDSLLAMDMDCFLGTMLKLQIVSSITDCYDKVRAFNKKVADKYREVLKADYSYVPLVERNSKRIVIITEQMLNDRHAPTKVVLNHVYALKKKGYEVVVFVCPSDLEIQEGIWHNSSRLNSVDGRENTKIQYKDIVFEMHEYVMNERILLNYIGMLDYIYEYKPMFVYSMGIVNPIADLTGDFITLVAQKFAVGLPVSDAKILVELNTDDVESDLVEGYNEGQIIVKQKEFTSFFEKSDIFLDRKQLNLPDDRFLISIVGNRLIEEIDAEFIIVMKNIVKAVPESCFVIVGAGDKLVDLLSDSELEGHIILYGYCSELMTLYNAIDLYVNPKRLGGGYSSAMALVAGVPVVTLPDCDVAVNTGEEFVVDNYGAMIETVKRYYSDPKYYQEQKKKAIEYASKQTEEKMVDTINLQIEKLINLIEMRDTNDSI